MNPEYICTGCISNRSLIKYINTHYSKRIKYCPLCGQKNRLAINRSELAYYIDSCIFHNYSYLDDRDGIDYDSENDCFYYVDTNDEVDFTNIHTILEENNVLSSIIDYDTRTQTYMELFNSIYPPRNIYAYLTETGWIHAASNDLFFTWETFNYLIQNNNRFFDFNYRHRSEYLDKIFNVLREYEEEIPADTILYRVRKVNSLSSDILDSPNRILKEIAPPPCKYTQSYRMSPKGISYTYLSTDVKTCLKECASRIHDNVLIGKFKTKTKLHILNLEIKEFPYYDLFSGHLDRERENIGYFIERYSSEISKPVSSTNDFEYLPTQVIAEYIRLQGYDGIAYSSAKTQKTNYVFFYGPDYYRFPDTRPKGWNFYIDSVPAFTKVFELTRCEYCEILNSRSCNYNIKKTIDNL